MEINYYNLAEEITYTALNEQSTFTAIDFTITGVVEINNKAVVFNMPSLVAAKRTISRMENGPVRAMFNDVLGHYRTASEEYYKQNSSICKQHVELGWISDPTSTGFVH